MWKLGSGPHWYPSRRPPPPRTDFCRLQSPRPQAPPTAVSHHMQMTGTAAECAAGSPRMLANQRAAWYALREHRSEPTAAQSACRMPRENESVIGQHRRRRSSGGLRATAAGTAARLRRPPPLPPTLTMQPSMPPGWPSRWHARAISRRHRKRKPRSQTWKSW